MQYTFLHQQDRCLLLRPHHNSRTTQSPFSVKFKIMGNWSMVIKSIGWLCRGAENEEGHEGPCHVLLLDLGAGSMGAFAELGVIKRNPHAVCTSMGVC